MKKIFTLFLALAASVGLLHAEVFNGTCGENLSWELNTTTGVLTIDGNGNMDSYWSTTPWTEYASLISSVNLPDGLTSIGSFAFSGCTSLTSITIPNGVTSIGVAAFQDCTSLTSLELPESVSHIGEEGAFYNCGISSPVYNSHLFAFCPPSYVGAYTIPNGITTIASGAFDRCINLTSVTFSTTLSTIESYAFFSCNQLTSIDIPSGVNTIGESAFRECTSLTSIKIPNSVTNIGQQALGGCSSLTSIYNYAETPQTSVGGKSGIFSGDSESLDANKYTCKLYVPEESIPFYRVATEWRDFAYIEAIETSQDIENIVSEKQRGVKEMCNGQVLIKKNDKIYMITGAEVK